MGRSFSTLSLENFPFTLGFVRNRRRTNFFSRPVNPVNLVTREPESGIGVQGAQGVQGEICAGCAGVHGLFSKSLCRVCRCARSFQKLFLSGGVHTKNFFKPVCTDLWILFLSKFSDFYGMTVNFFRYVRALWPFFFLNAAQNHAQE